MTELIATIVPAYLNPPKPAKSGKGMTPPSVKTDRGDYFTVPKSIPLEAFTPGVPVEVGFTEAQNGPYVNRNITRIVESQTRPIQQPPKSQPQSFRQQTAPKDSQQIYVTALMKELVKVLPDPLDPKARIRLGLELRIEYNTIFGPVQKQETEAEFDDEIPGF